ncbi:FAD-binding and (Fe-S)-binding domain-containing protein [Falsirhodobacter halotolerans]|uniref:FAD-binding and (Fe-S)-binding domain-containing protein n=1 Tax=Falsirhodobacter halotolerans TaxID=1146892 RepID=UPI001FD44BFD|nr:FAD-binding and (Fe-S)-binding domain-containing protein [Falsirhodobacter halotolerans]MCJ8140940.1 FAD-binding oxidoreductase [Falsirhodobacter halotolerans]
MKDHIDAPASLPFDGAAFRQALAARGFRGQVRTDRAARVVNATDNSIYYREPDCVIEPRSAEDVAAAVAAAAEVGVPITPRGGGTGTNGQALAQGVVLDLSRFMNRIVAFHEEEGIVRVEPGVVLDQLNAFLKARGYVFPPAVSTGSRATLGGMVATDASGKGSRRYGRTSDYLVSAEVVLADGRPATVGDLAADAPLPPGPLGQAAALLRDRLPALSGDIARVFPPMNRGLTGYNLDEVRGPNGELRLTKLLAGSEGTLAVATALDLRVVKLPKHFGIAIIGYADSLVALGAVADLLPADPDAIEFLDDRTVHLGKTSPAWPVLEPVLGADLASSGGYLFAEVSADTPEAVADRLAAVERAALAATTRATGLIATQDAAVMAALNGLRKDAVGLMGKGKGAFKGVAFVEDAAVPPENLVAFVAGFRDILDAHGLEYGMYGHADVGCVHVRPLMDMRRPEHRAKIRPISDAVADLARAQNGLIWGEHGKGVRGEYVELYFGPDLFAFLRRIKAAFDPANRLNPGKLVTAFGTDLAVDRIDAIPFRGARDERIAGHTAFAKASECNGNGACFHWDSANEMCPSYKATRDRVQSPKGRAALIRDWLDIRDTGGDAAPAADALAASLATCLSCKACTSQCPVHVDIPTLKAEFLADRYAHRSRPLRDRLVRHMEALTLVAARVPRLANLGMAIAQGGLARAFGLVDLPRFGVRGLEARMRAAGARRLAPGEGLPAGVDRDNAALLVCDSFLGPFEPEVLESAARVLARLGVQVFHTPIQRNGKAAQVRGYLDAFRATRDAAVARIDAYAALGVPLVTVEPAVTMLYRQDYKLEEGVLTSLDRVLMSLADRMPTGAGARFRLIGHCTETSADPGNLTRWQRIFAAAGLALTPQRAGCCGMAGMFGHEAENRALSRQVFDLDWAEKIGAGDEVLATGFSCRGQAERFAGARLRHPVQALEAALRVGTGGAGG